MNKIKILHLFDSYLPPTENWAYKMIAALPDCEIHIGANNYLKNNFYHPRFHFIDNPIGALNHQYLDLNKKHPVELFKKLFLKSIPFVLHDPIEDIIEHAKVNGIQLVHAHFANIGWDFRKIAERLNIPFVLSFYGWDYEKLPHTQPVFQQRFKILFQIADGFICEGKHGASILIKYGCPKEKIFVVPLGVMPDQIPVIKRTKFPDQLNLVQLASFTEKKGQIYALEAVGNLIKECPNLTLTFIGDERQPELKTRLLQKTKTLNLSNQVTFLPAINYENLYTTLQKFDVFIHPSCYAADKDCEGGAPIVLLDAQATGMPVIATTHCGIPEEVIHGKTGLLGPEKQIEALMENIRIFYKMKNEEFQQFAKNARKHVETNFDVIKNAEILKAVYQKIINNQ